MGLDKASSYERLIMKCVFETVTVTSCSKMSQIFMIQLVFFKKRVMDRQIDRRTIQSLLLSCISQQKFDIEFTGGGKAQLNDRLIVLTRIYDVVFTQNMCSSKNMSQNHR